MRTRVSDEEFVKCYMQYSGDRHRIADELGMSFEGVKMRITRYRKAGVRLPLRRKINKLDVTGLNSLIRSYK